MICRMKRIVPALVCGAAAMLIAGCSDDIDREVGAQAAASEASGEASETQDTTQQRQPESENDNAEDADANNALPPVRSAVDAASDAASRSARASASESRDAAFVIRAEPDVLNLGELSTRERKTGLVTLTNVGDRPMTIEGSRTDCGCTVANVPQGESLAPGESVEVEVSLRGGTRPQQLRKNVTFMFSDQPNIRVPVLGNVIAHVTIEPSTLHPDRTAENRVVIRADDDVPFRILRVHPDIIESVSEEAATSHELFIDWEKWEEQHEARRILFTLDHPKADRVMANVHVQRRSAADDLAARGRDGRTAQQEPQVNLPRLVQRNNTERVAEMLGKGMDVNETDDSGVTMIGLAARHGHVDMIQLLLANDADPNVGDRGGRTPLMTAGRAGHEDVIHALLEGGAEVDARDTIGTTALGWTAGFGNAASVKALLEAGAEVDAASNLTGFTPLIWAAGFGDAENVKLLIEAGAEINVQDTTAGMTPLMHAARRGKSDIITLLVDAGADIEIADNSGKTAVLWVAGSNDGTVEALNTLLEAGAQVNATDRRGQSALDHSRGRSDDRAGAMVQRLGELLGNDNDDD